MSRAIAVAVCCLAFAVHAQSAPAAAVDPAQVEKYTEADTWSNRSNFYVGMRGGVAIPSGAIGLAEQGGVEVGVANESGMGFGLHALWMNQPPGAPVLNVPAAKWGLGALLDLRYYFPTIEPLTIYPTLSGGFVAGPSAKDGTNSVLPLIDPGVGARVKLGSIYAAFEFGFAGFTIPYVVLSFGYQSDRRQERAEKWAREQERAALELKETTPTEVQLQAARKAYHQRMVEQAQQQRAAEEAARAEEKAAEAERAAALVQQQLEQQKARKRPAPKIDNDPSAEWSTPR